MFYTLRVRIKNMARWESNSMKMLGVIEIILGIMLLAPVVIAFIYGEDATVFIYPIPLLLISGTAQYVLFKSNDSMKPANGMFMMFVAWWIAFFVSAIPFYLYGFSFIDSLFEGVSGFTTTGSSIAGDLTELPYSILFWRSFTQWAGGIAVVMIFLFLIPMMGLGGRAFVNNELAGSQSYNFSMRIKNAAKNFLSIYVILSAVEVVLLLFSGVETFEAVAMTLSTISTGGFMVSGDSIASYSFLVQAIVLAFMFLGGTNFYLHYRAIHKREFSAYRKSQEFVWTVMWFILASLIIFVILIAGTTDLSAINAETAADTFWSSLFTVVSMGTTTGYTISDPSLWPHAAFMVLWMVMLFGSMSGSTSGGMKIYRLLILKSYITNGVYRMFHPRTVRDVRLDGHSVDNDTVVSSIVVIMMFLVALLVSSILLLLTEPGIAVAESVGLSLSAIGNVGVNTGGIPFQDLSGLSKIILSFLMWAGRLEIVMVMLLFSRTFWLDLASGAGNSNRKVNRIKRF